MKGLPSNIDLSPLSATEIIQLCFGTTQLQIHFANKSSIMVESAMILHSAEGEMRVDDYAQAATQLCRLLGERVVTATRGADGGLSLRFEGGTRLEVLNDNERFESLQVRVGGHTYLA